MREIRRCIRGVVSRFPDGQFVLMLVAVGCDRHIAGTKWGNPLLLEHEPPFC